MIHSTDPDFHVCRIGFDTLLEIQLEAEDRGWATRWTSVDALRGQVKDEAVLLQSLMREERGGRLRAYRCLVLFSTVDGDEAGGCSEDVRPHFFASDGRDIHGVEKVVVSDMSQWSRSSRGGAAYRLLPVITGHH
jgi:hypothetical protein